MLTTDPLVFSHPLIAVAVLAIVVIGAIVQSGLGMGFGLTVAPVLALIDPALVPAPALYLGMSTAIVGALRERENIVWREVKIGMVGRGVGILLGLWLLFYLTDRATFSLVFGIIILIAVGFTLAGRELALNAKNLLSMGLVSGFTGVITSVGAPPLALIYQNRDARTARPTLAAFFAFGGFMSLFVLYISGLANLSHFYLALFMAPAAIVGTLIGQRLKGRFDKRYRSGLLGIAVIAGVLLVMRGFG